MDLGPGVCFRCPVQKGGGLETMLIRALVIYSGFGYGITAYHRSTGLEK